jgi:acyl dehydratase
MTSPFPHSLKDRVGETRTYVAPEPIGAAAFRYFSQAVGDDNPLYYDEDFARAAGYASVIAPPTLVCETNQYAGVPPNEFGYAGHDWGIHIDGTRLLRGGNSYEFFEPVKPSDVLTVTWKIVDVSERTSSSGSPLLIINSEAEYHNQDGHLLVRNQETLIIQPVGKAT